MTIITDMEPLRQVAFSAALLGGKMLLMSVGTASIRTLYGNFGCNGEDYTVFHKLIGSPLEDKRNKNSDALVARIQRAQTNALENESVFVGLATIAALLGVSGLGNLIKLFVAARCAHSATYILGLQPLRTISFVVGLSASGTLVYKLAIASKN